MEAGVLSDPKDLKKIYVGALGACLCYRPVDFLPRAVTSS
jgi:hypothetical protein